MTKIADIIPSLHHKHAKATTDFLSNMAVEGFRQLRGLPLAPGNLYFGAMRRPLPDMWSARVLPSKYGEVKLRGADEVAVDDIRLATKRRGRLGNLALYAPGERLLAVDLRGVPSEARAASSLAVSTIGTAYHPDQLRREGGPDYPRQLAVAGAVAAAVRAAHQIEIGEDRARKLLECWRDVYDLSPVTPGPQQPFWMAAFSPNWQDVVPYS